MKFTKEQKLAMAREHVDDHVPLYQLYEKYGIGGQHAKYFIALYKKHGAKAFEDKGTRTSYTRDFKLECIKRHIYGGESQYSIALDIGLAEPSTIRDRDEQMDLVSNIGNYLLLNEEVNKTIKNKYIDLKVFYYNQIIPNDLSLKTPMNTVDFVKFENERKSYIIERQKDIALTIKNTFPFGAILIQD